MCTHWLPLNRGPGLALAATHAARLCPAPAGKVGATVVETACVIELPALNGRAKLDGIPLFVLVEKEGE